MLFLNRLRTTEPAILYSRSSILGLVLLIGLVAGVTYLWNAGQSKRAETVREVKSIAVLPLKNLTDDPSEEYFSDGLTESLINELSKVRELKVIARTSVFALKGQALDAREVGRRLGVAALLEGGLRKEGETVRVTVRLVSTEDGRVIWAGDSFQRPLKEIIAVQDEIACRVAENLRAVLCGELVHQPGTQNLAAFDAYLQGTQWRRKGVAEKAIEFFEQATKLDPNYALAWAGLAEAWTIMETHAVVPPRTAAPKARAYAATALALDETLAAPYAALGLLASFSDRNWAEGRQYFQQALARNPNYATAHAWYASTLLAQGKFEEAEAALLRAQELDPLSASIANSLAEIYYYWRRPDRCLAIAARLAALDPTHDGAYRNRVRCYCLQGRSAEAEQAAQKVTEPALQATIQIEIFGRTGRTAEARRLLEPLARGAVGQRSPYVIGCLYARLGDTEQAFAWLNKAAEQQQADLVSLKIDPAVDSLRSDPRFQDLLRRVGLP